MTFAQWYTDLVNGWVFAVIRLGVPVFRILLVLAILGSVVAVGRWVWERVANKV